MAYIFDITDPGHQDKANQLFILSKALRHYQRRYFRTRNYKDLDLARKAESELDKFIKQIENPKLSLTT